MCLNLGRRFDASVIPNASQQAKPTTDFTDRDLDPLGAQSQLNICDYLSSSPSKETNFSGMYLQHGLAIGLLELFELFLVLLADIQRHGAQSVFHATLGIIDPFFNFGGG